MARCCTRSLGSIAPPPQHVNRPTLVADQFALEVVREVSGELTFRPLYGELYPQSNVQLPSVLDVTLPFIEHRLHRYPKNSAKAGLARLEDQ